MIIIRIVLNVHNLYKCLMHALQKKYNAHKKSS